MRAQAAPELIDWIAAENDIVLTATGDCGSCCSACVRDATALEKLGLPSAVIITTEFARETELTRQAVGMKALELVVIESSSRRRPDRTGPIGPGTMRTPSPDPIGR